MAKLQAYRCQSCGNEYEFLHHPSDEPAQCPACESTEAELQLGGAPLLTVIVPTYPGCKRNKAGFIHSHGDKPAEKGSVQVPTSFKGESP